MTTANPSAESAVGKRGGAELALCALPSASCSTFEVTTKRSETLRAGRNIIHYYTPPLGRCVAFVVGKRRCDTYIYFSTFLFSIVDGVSDENAYNGSNDCQPRTIVV